MNLVSIELYDRLVADIEAHAELYRKALDDIHSLVTADEGLTDEEIMLFLRIGDSYLTCLDTAEATLETIKGMRSDEIKRTV